MATDISGRTTRRFPWPSIFARAALVVCGAAVLLWSMNVFSAVRRNAEIAAVANNILFTHHYRTEALGAFLDKIAGLDDTSVRGSVASAIAVIRLRAAEDALKAGTQEIDSRLDAFLAAADRALAADPSNAFVWLARFWAANTRHGDIAGNQPSLRAAYLFGPNEGWIALRRNPLAIAVRTSLSADLADAPLGEFVRLVRSGLFAEAAEIFVGPGAASQAALVSRIKQLDRADVLSFERAVAARDDRVAAALGQSLSPFVALDKLIEDAAKGQGLVPLWRDEPSGQRP